MVWNTNLFILIYFSPFIADFFHQWFCYFLRIVFFFVSRRFFLFISRWFSQIIISIFFKRKDFISYLSFLRKQSKRINSLPSVCVFFYSFGFLVDCFYFLFLADCFLFISRWFTRIACADFRRCFWKLIGCECGWWMMGKS